MVGAQFVQKLYFVRDSSGKQNYEQLIKSQVDPNKTKAPRAALAMPFVLVVFLYQKQYCLIIIKDN